MYACTIREPFQSNFFFFRWSFVPFISQLKHTKPEAMIPCKANKFVFTFKKCELETECPFDPEKAARSHAYSVFSGGVV